MSVAIETLAAIARRALAENHTPICGRRLRLARSGKTRELRMSEMLRTEQRQLSGGRKE